ncbi:unnamed protein product, partial [Ectocarpus sp. 12 AP-2014]
MLCFLTGREFDLAAGAAGAGRPCAAVATCAAPAAAAAAGVAFVRVAVELPPSSRVLLVAAVSPSGVALVALAVLGLFAAADPAGGFTVVVLALAPGVGRDAAVDTAGLAILAELLPRVS